MDRAIYAFIVAASGFLGICLAIWPTRIVGKSRDAADREPAPGELMRMRIVGAAVAALAAYGLYAIARGMPGGEITPA
jgi:hypothetical protein